MKKTLLIIATLLAIGASSCKKDFLSQEANPNTPSSTTPGFALAAAEKVAADVPNGWYTIAATYGSYAYCGVWVGYWTPSGNYVPSASLSQYNFTNSSFQTWTETYTNISNFKTLETLAAATPSLANYQAISKIMEAYDFQQLVDVYNDVPYTQAFQTSANFFPTYDKGQDIYNDLLKQLDAAIAMINSNTTATNPGTADIIFKGNMTSWKKFANSIKLRIAVRQSNITANFAALKAALATTASEGYLDETVQAAANPGYLLSDISGGQESPFWHAYGTDQNGTPTTGNLYYRANAFAVGLYQKYNDPRIGKYYATTTLPAASGGGTGYRGNIFGDVNVLANANTSAIGPGLLKSATMDAIVFSGWESLFLQSEAVYRGLITGSATAQALYQRAITASFVNVGLTAAQATTYYGQPVQNVSWESSNTPTNAGDDPKIEAIVTQKYFSLNGYGNLEAFNEYRRTGFPVGVPRSIDAKTVGTTIPSRIYYPSTEYSTNAKAVGAEGTINVFTSKIFWAK